MRLAICTPTTDRPHPAYLDALEASARFLDEKAVDHKAVFKVGNPYISYARAEMLRQALDDGRDTFLFIDHDMSWRPEDLWKIIQIPDPVVAGTYRFKTDDVSYMATVQTDASNRPLVRDDGCIQAEHVPAGFLKLTLEAVRKFMRGYPELVFGHAEAPSIDLFNHGAHDGVWWGEDYAFSRRWLALGEEIWIVPDLALTHHATDKDYPGNFHKFLLRQPGGSDDDRP